jgi:hypothetical protein
MGEILTSYQRQTTMVNTWAKKLDARDSLVAAIQSSPGFPAGATLELLFAREANDAGENDVNAMENRINDDVGLWQARIVGTEAKQSVTVPDLRALASELGLPIPAAVQRP